MRGTRLPLHAEVTDAGVEVWVLEGDAAEPVVLPDDAIIGSLSMAVEMDAAPPIDPSLTCLWCGTTAEPAERVGAVWICANCGSTLSVDAAGTVRRARFDDVNQLSATDVMQIVRARARIARPERRQR